MLRFRIFPIILLLLLALASAARGAEEAVISGRDKFYDIEFVPPDSFWVVGYPGKILCSRDGAKTWEQRGAGKGEAFFAVEFIDPQHGWISGRGGIVLHTSDAGKSWNRQETGVEESIFDLQFVNPAEGWAVGHFGTIIHTRDGGKTWERQYLNRDLITGAGEEGDAFVVDDSGSVFLRDAGEERAEIPSEREIDPSLNGVYFRNVREGWVAGEFGTIYRTRDGGESWEAQESGVRTSIFAVRFAGDGTGWAVGPKGVVLKTRDQGKNWIAILVPAPENLFQIGFRGEEVWVLGDHGLVLRSASGTGEFRLVSMGIYSWFSGVAFSDEGEVLVVGGGGKIISVPPGAESQ
jgi:photosystem II stability/assembly factor-like uncharacterized protein